jgi:spore germination protein YaaH
MAEIEIGEETEGKNNWAYRVRVFDAGKTHDYAVTLSFRDYDLWSHGTVAPSKVVEKAFKFLLEREPATSILSKFDCSVIRRYFPEVDAELPKMGGGGGV